MYPKLIRNRKEWHLGTLPQGCQVDGTGSFEGEIATRKLIESTQSIFGPQNRVLRLCKRVLIRASRRFNAIFLGN